jgi:hypothetical protein
VRLAGVERDRDALQGVDRAERLRRVLEGEDWCLVGQGGRSGRAGETGAPRIVF